ncbi:MAG TPA: hypothetical protein VFG23_26810, partial [Polyangia bacterium]|nr:hypothetical protein [Polyangia bacterium]
MAAPPGENEGVIPSNLGGQLRRLRSLVRALALDAPIRHGLRKLQARGVPVEHRCVSIHQPSPRIWSALESLPALAPGAAPPPPADAREISATAAAIRPRSAAAASAPPPPSPC